MEDSETDLLIRSLKLGKFTKGAGKGNIVALIHRIIRVETTLAVLLQKIVKEEKLCISSEECSEITKSSVQFTEMVMTDEEKEFHK